MRYSSGLTSKCHPCQNPTDFETSTKIFVFTGIHLLLCGRIISFIRSTIIILLCAESLECTS